MGDGMEPSTEGRGKPSLGGIVREGGAGQEEPGAAGQGPGSPAEGDVCARAEAVSRAQQRTPSFARVRQRERILFLLEKAGNDERPLHGERTPPAVLRAGYHVEKGAAFRAAGL